MESDAFSVLDARVASLARARFGQATEVQEKAFPLAMAGKDFLAIAPTGSGKMEAAFLPLLSRVLKRIDAGERGGVMALYITPLKALNRDMLERMQYWCKLTGVSLAVRHGDTTQTERARQRDSPPICMVTTPESLAALLIGPKIRYAFANVRTVVVDEVHELVDSKRGSQLSLLLERLRQRAGKLQVVGLSATVGNEKKVASFLSRDAIVVKAELARGLQLRVEYPSKCRDEALWKLDSESCARIQRVVDVINSSSGTLVFVNTRSLAESLASTLFQTAEVKDKVGVHHGSLSKEARLQTEREFKKADRLKAVVCTSSLELGIDVGTVQKVVQYHSPRQVSRLLQRVGRSGHRKGLTPSGIILPASPLDCCESGVLCKGALERRLEEPRFFEKPLDVLAQQVVGMALDAEGKPVKLQDALLLCRKAFPYRNLTAGELAQVCKQLHDERLLYFSGDFTQFSAARASLLYYYENLSTIRDSKKFFLKSAETKRNVALLDERFVAEFLQEGSVFICRGVPWRVLSIVEEEVIVEQSKEYSAAVPDWIGEEIPFAFETAQGVAMLLSKAAAGSS
ncbi:MAG: DEAD/DEAH box helicase, partial [Candidatus Micrarchaeota archaeon]